MVARRSTAIEEISGCGIRLDDDFVGAPYNASAPPSLGLEIDASGTGTPSEYFATDYFSRFVIVMSSESSLDQAGIVDVTAEPLVASLEIPLRGRRTPPRSSIP